MSRDIVGDGWRRNRNETRTIKCDDRVILSSVGYGMKRPTHAEQEQTWSFRRLHQIRVARSAEFRLEQKEDYGRDVSSITSGGKPPPPVVKQPLNSCDFYRLPYESLYGLRWL